MKVIISRWEQGVSQQPQLEREEGMFRAKTGIKGNIWQRQNVLREKLRMRTWTRICFRNRGWEESWDRVGVGSIRECSGKVIFIISVNSLAFRFTFTIID